MQPIPSRADDMSGTVKCRTVRQAAKVVTTSMIGASVSSAVLVPTLPRQFRSSRQLFHDSELCPGLLDSRASSAMLRLALVSVQAAASFLFSECRSYF
jgi:hypothetical protein